MSIWGKTVSFGGGGGSIEGGGNIKGFEVYTADNKGGTRNNTGKMPNGYFVCFFHDNMSDDYKLNGTTYSYPIAMNGNGIAKIKAETKAVSDNINRGVDAELDKGSAFETTHNDSGSYISVVGGWVGYRSGGTVYKNAVTGTVNSITLNRAHETLLVFVGGSAQGLSQNTIDINGNTYTIANIGAMFDNVYGVYGAIEIDNNSDTVIEVTFPSSCYNFVSIIGINGSEDSGNIDLSYLPNSTAANVLASQDATLPLNGTAWGNASFAVPIASNSRPELYDGAIRKPASTACFCDTGSPNHGITAYCCLRSYNSTGGQNLGIMQVPYGYSGGNDPNFFVNNYGLWTSVYGDDTNESIDMSSYHVLAMSIDSANNRVNFYIDGEFRRYKGYSNAGAVVFFGCAGYDALKHDVDIKYIGVVTGCEADATIMANMQTIMQKLGITG